jgi:hypothetical protein
MPAIAKPKTRRLNCRNPNIVQNYINGYEKLASRNRLSEKTLSLLSRVSYPLSQTLQLEYERIDSIRCQITAAAEKKCRKLKAGQVSFSPEIQQAHRSMKAWNLLQKRAAGRKISSRLLSRSLNKVGIQHSVISLSLQQIEQELNKAYKDYWALQASHKALRNTFLDNLAERLAESHNVKKGNMIKQLKERELQRQTARRIRYLRGKLKTGSTTMFTVDTAQGQTEDITTKRGIEDAIIRNNEEKFKQSHHNEFYQPPLAHDLEHLHMPDSVKA